MRFFDRFRKEPKSEQETETTAILRMFVTFDVLQKQGLISFDVKSRRLFIEEPVARVMMVSAKKWTAFMENAFYWLYYHQCQEVCERFFQKEEAEAVNRARRKYAMLTHADIMRIRHARREEIKRDDIEMPKVEPFEFYVIREQSEKPSDDTKQEVPAGKIILVGSYDYDSESLKMVDWDHVKAMMDEQNE